MFGRLREGSVQGSVGGGGAGLGRLACSVLENWNTGPSPDFSNLTSR